MANMTKGKTIKMEKRFKAFLTHIIVSALVGLAGAVVVFFFWCPAPLDKAIGVREIFLLMLLVDVTLGPVVTFITYKPTPGFLKFDLPVIVLCQIIMMSYGMYAVFQGRPAFIVYSDASFTVVRMVDIEPKTLIKARQNNNAAAVADWLRPHWVATPPSFDPFSDLVISADSFRPLEQAKTELLTRSQPLSELRALYKAHPADSAELNDLREADVKWMPLKASKNMVVLIDSHSAAIVKIVDLDPNPKVK